MSDKPPLTFNWPEGKLRTCGICEETFDPAREGLAIESIDHGSALRCGKCLEREKAEKPA